MRENERTLILDRESGDATAPDRNRNGKRTGGDDFMFYVKRLSAGI